MADDSNRIGGPARVTGATAALSQVRKVAGVGSAAFGGDTGSVSVDGGGAPPARSHSFGPRGSRMLPADYPSDQLDRRAARGTYLDILV